MFVYCVVVALQGVDTLTLTSMRTLVSKLVAPEDQGTYVGTQYKTESVTCSLCLHTATTSTCMHACMTVLYYYINCHSLLKGAVLGILATGDALSALLSAIAWPNIYDTIINHNLSPGDTFMIMAGVGLLAIPLLL